MTSRQLSQTDLDRCISALPSQLLELLKKHGSNLMVAGGFIRAVVAGEKPSDIDIAIGKEIYPECLAQDLAVALGGDYSASPRAFTVRRPGAVPIQFVYAWQFGSPAEALDSFDFTISQAAIWWDGEQWTSLVSCLFYPDVKAKRLTYTSPIRKEAVAGSLFRVFKFYKRGYSIDLVSLAAVLARATRSDAPVPTILDLLLEAGARLPAPPQRCAETSDDIGEGSSAFVGGGSG